MEHKGNDYTNCDWCFRYNYKRIIQNTGGLGNRRTSRDHRNYTIVDYSENTEKSTGDLRRLVTQTPVKEHQLKLM